MAKKEKYRLEALYGIRERAKDEAEQLYAKKMAEVAAQKKILEDMRETLKEMAARREVRKKMYKDKLAAGELSVMDAVGNDRHIERMQQEEYAYAVKIQRQVEAVEDAKEEAEEAKEEMIKAMQEFKALEKHKEKWEKKVKYERERKEEEAVEDIVQAQYYKRLREREEEGDS